MIGGLALYGSVLIAFDKEYPKWLALLGILMGILMMYEILFGLILIGVAYALFGMVAALPTSVAVIIAALIIANSRQRK